MSAFQGATNVRVQGGTQVAAGTGSSVTIYQIGHGDSSSAFQNLSAVAAHAALHNSAARFDAPRCYRNTRATYLNKLELWLRGTSAEFAGIHLIWLHGGAGVGKSAIMQSIVECCVQHSVILGTFFFFRSDPSRNYVEVLIPTLAYQLARSFPAAMAILEVAINHDPLIFTSSLHTQAYELIVRPILHLFDTGVLEKTTEYRRVFVIDGLDESTDPQKQAVIINVVASILDEYQVPVSFLMASRPEIAISRAFQMETRLYGIFADIPLDDNAESRSDIRQFIEDNFRDIVDSHPMRNHISLPWPHPKSVDELVRKSSGHFIYAATAMKFIASSDEHPARALHVIEGLESSRTRSPFTELDALYFHIIASAKYLQYALAILRQCFLINLGSLNSSEYPTYDGKPRGYSVPYISLLQNMSEADIDLFLSDLHALVSVTFDAHSNVLVVRPKHLSLEDFFKDGARSQGLYIAPGPYHASLLPDFFKYLNFSGTRLNFTCSMSYRTPFRKDIATRGYNTLILALCEAIKHCLDIELLTALLQEHPLGDVWLFHQQSPSSIDRGEHDWTATVRSFSVSKYMAAIRDCIGDKDHVLYMHQFPIYMKFLLDSFNSNSGISPRFPQPLKRIRAGSWNADNLDWPSPTATSHMIQALLFSSTRSTLRSTHHLIFKFHSEFGIDQWQACYLGHLVDSEHSSGIDQRTMDALRHMPQRQVLWRSEIAAAMELVFRCLLNQSWKPPFYFANRHEQWLKRTKPSKDISTGLPQLSSRFYDYERRFKPITKYNYDLPYYVSLPPARGPFSPKSSNSCHYPPMRGSRYLCNKGDRSMCNEGYDCILLLNAVISFLRKAELTREVVRLARKSLPKVALWFPKLMKKARREMDDYVRRWEESTGGLLEKAGSLSINNLD